MSEAATSKHIFEPYAKNRITLELGYGGYRSFPWAWTQDMPVSYTNVGSDSQQLRGDARRLPYIADGAIECLIQCHLLEDWTYEDQVEIMKEHYRILAKGAFYCHNMPDEIAYRKHCRDSGQEHLRNLAHKNEDFSLRNWNEKVIANTGPWEVVFEEPNHGPYSWLQVLKKI